MENLAEDSALENVLEAVAREGIEGWREQVLLWLIRNQYDVGEADSYEYVLPAGATVSDDVMIDAALVVQRRDITAAVYFLLADSPKELTQRVKRLTAEFAASVTPELVFSRRNLRLRSIFEPAVGKDARTLVRTVVCVCTAPLTRVQQAAIARASQDGSATVEVLDRAFLLALARAAQEGATQQHGVTIDIGSAQLLDLKIDTTKAVVLPVYATAVAEWPGIEDRSLFDLNVRHALGVNKVRKSLDGALVDPTSADEFIAYHNGLTAVCRSFNVDGATLRVEGLSIVNGAQTVVAIHANAERLAPNVRLLLKLIEAEPESKLARNIAIRSNTQNPVTSRNLRALDPVQERLVQEIGNLGYVYVVRPDQATPANAKVILNDDSAQLLCSIYVRKPAMAVKRQVLFESPQYEEIFPPSLSASKIVFAHITRQVVEEHKQFVPEYYRGAWALTSLAMVYMTSEAMRADKKYSEILRDPASELASPQLRTDIATFVGAACEVLEDRRSRFEASDNENLDDFKVAFKQTRTLGDLGSAAAQTSRRNSRKAIS